MSKSNIEWTDETKNIGIGCTKVSEGCRNCYAIKEAWIHSFHPNKKINSRYAGTVQKNENGTFNWTGKVNIDINFFAQVLRQKKGRKIFINSMTDLFHENVNFDTIHTIFIIMALAPQHTFQIVTKRANRLFQYYQQYKNGLGPIEEIEIKVKKQFTEYTNCIINNKIDVANPLKNVWVLVSAENQATANERIPYLVQIPAAVHGLSCEPLLGEIDLSIIQQQNEHLSIFKTINWIIAGGESGSKARPMHPAWLELLQKQCEHYKIPFFFKQYGSYCFGSDLVNISPKNHFIVLKNGDVLNNKINIADAAIEYMDNNNISPMEYSLLNPHIIRKVSKKISGHLLNGKVFQQFP